MSILVVVPLGSIVALVFAGFLTWHILQRSEGSAEMKSIAEAVREGASAYLWRQFGAVALFFAVVFVGLLILALRDYFVIFVPFAFVTGGILSGLSGFCGMKIATATSARTAEACRTSLNQGLRLAFSSGAVMGFCVVGFGLLGIIAWYYGLQYYYTHHVLPDGKTWGQVLTSTLLCLGMGGSFMAFFARVGGGIFTKAADVGADLVGKVEVGIPEDDARNPAVIADNVGDNVGDVAGMGADLYESYVGSIVATAALGVAAGLGRQGVIFPMVMAAFGIFASMVGFIFVRCGEDPTQEVLLRALRKGILIASLIIGVMTFYLVGGMLGWERIGLAWSVLIGIVSGILIGACTEYFTSAQYKPTQHLAHTARTGPATIIIEGLAVGMASTAFPVLIIGGAIIGSFGFAGGFDNAAMGLYGIGVAAVGMLSTLGMTLATDAYGPVADNAGGNAQMAGLPPEVRQRTDALDSVGNTTAAIGKGFAIGSAALTALALIATFKEQVVAEGGVLILNLMNPLVLVGLFIGAMMPHFFSALTMRAVGRAAGQVVMEVRRQFKEISGIMEGTARPDYARCVSLVTKASIKEMGFPALVAIGIPLIVGLTLGVNAVGGLLIGATASGFILAIMMANAGGAWDNAKKYIEEGHVGGRGLDAHKASVVGDTVGDPFKDTAGPSINILIKLMSMVSIVFASFMVHFGLF